MDDEFIVEEEDALKDFLPGGFGKRTKETNIAAQIDRSRRPTETATKTEPHNGNGIKAEDASNDSDGGDDDDEDDDDSDPEDEFPISHELVLKTHEKAVTTVTLDPSGARLLSGSNDCTIKFHDFSSMTPTTLRAFKSVDPTATKTSASSEIHPIHHLAFNPLSPAQVLVITATPQARIYSRDGDLQLEFKKGDMYLRDMHNTKGHVSEITTGTWHPTNRDLCVTAGTDSTLRIWDVNVRHTQKEVIVHKSRAAGSAGRTRMTAVAWSSAAQGGSSVLAAAALDGSIVMWSGDGPYTRPAGEIRDAHVKDTWTGGIDISPDGRTIVTRGGDNTIKLWDTRKFKQPVSVAEHPSTSDRFSSTNIRFAPNGASIITGSETGHLHILNPATLRPEVVTPVTPGSPLITVLWHDKLNQIITGSANAETRVLYSPSLSTKGAAMVMSKAPKLRHVDDDPSLTTDLAEGLSGDSIVNASGMAGSRVTPRNPTIGLTASGKSRDPRRPHVPQTTPFSKNNPDELHIRASIPLSSMRDEDPREALLKYADKAQKDPMFTNAWRETQPKTIYAELSDEEEETGPDKKKPRRA